MEGFKPIVLDVKPWQCLIIPPPPPSTSSDQKDDVHFVVRMSPSTDIGGRPEQPYAWPEPNVLEVGLEVRPRFWNPWIKVIAVEDVMFAVCKCYKTEPWTDEISDLTEDDIKLIINGWVTNERSVLHRLVIEHLISIEGREKLTKAVEATENSDSRRITMSILDLSQLPVKNWYPVGLELGVEEGTLDRFTEQAHKEEECVVLMFDKWLSNHVRKACFAPMKLVAVLLDAGEMESARMVCQQYSIPEYHVPPKLQDLCLLPLVENEWHEVGEQLGVTKKQLAADEYDESQQGMFRCWLAMMKKQDFFRARYEEIINALYAVGDPDLAEHIIRKFKIHRALTKIPVPTKSHSENLMIDWNKFGQHLGFKGKNLGRKRHEIFKEWLKRNPKATYNKLVSDLSAIGDHEGAQSLCNRYGIRLPDASVAVLYDRETIIRQPQVKPANRALSNSQEQSVEGTQLPPHTANQDEKPKIWDLSDVITQIQGEWKDLARHLRFENFEVTPIEKDNKGVRDMCGDMLGKWLEGQGKRGPRNWRTLFQALLEMHKIEFVKELAAKIK